MPDRVLRAMAQPTIDHRGPAFAALGARGARRPAGASSRPRRRSSSIPSSGTGAWEAALVNTLSPGDTVLMFETGHFATLWRDMADAARPARSTSCPATGATASIRRSSKQKLADDRAGTIKAVAVVHNETSTGVDQPHCRRRGARWTRRGIRRCCSSTRSRRSASIDYRHDEWGVDVTVSGSQKGLMLPPGPRLQRDQREGARRVEVGAAAASLLGLGADAHATTRPASSRTRRRRTCSTACARRCEMLMDEGLPNVFARHAAASAKRRARAVDGVGARDPLRESRRVQQRADRGRDARRPRRRRVSRRSSSSASTCRSAPGLGKLKGKVFRIGHLGDFNDLMLAGTLSGVEMGLAAAGVPFNARRRHRRARLSGLADLSDVSRSGR